MLFHGYPLKLGFNFSPALSLGGSENFPHYVIPPWAANYVNHPGTKPNRTPVDTTGWTMPSGGGFADSAFDRSPASSFNDYAYPGTSFEIALSAARTLSGRLLDQAGVGPNPWPLTIYVPRTTYELHA